MLNVEVIGGADAEMIATQLEHLDHEGLLLVTTRLWPADSATAVALVVAAPSASYTRSDAELGHDVDVVLRHGEALHDQAARLWSARLAQGSCSITSVPRRSPASARNRFWTSSFGSRS